MSAEFTMFKVNATNQEWKNAASEGSLHGENVDLELLKGDKDGEFENNLVAGRLFGVPNIKGSYQKTFTECLINAFQMLSHATSKTLKRIDGETTNDGLPIELRNQVAEIGNVLQWIANSTSWRNGKYYPFDAFEIEQKLKNCIGYSYHSLKKERVTKKGKFPSFEAVGTDLIKRGEKSLIERDTLAELINDAIEGLDYEPRFFYTFDECFSLYSVGQLR